MPDHTHRLAGRRLGALLLASCLLLLAGLAPAPSHAALAPAHPGASAAFRELDPATAARVRARINRMSLAAKVGQVFMVSFPSTVVTADLLEWLKDWQVGGVIVFSRNIAGDAQLAHLLADANGATLAAGGLPLLVGIDQEGGLVRRIQYGPASLASAAYYGSLGPAGTTQLYRDAYNAGLALRRLGVTLDFAPVCDVLTNPYSPIGSRSYGADPYLVGRMAAAAIRGYQDAGVATTAKHFLGLGNTGIDAHNDLPTVGVSRAWLESHDLVPFRMAIKAGVQAIMTTHVVVPALDPTSLPADLSPTALSGMLRGELGFRGLVVADSLLMGAVTFHLGIAESAVQAVRAGNDLILLAQARSYPPAEMHAALLAVAQAVRTGRIAVGRLNDAVYHVLALKTQLGLLKP